MSATAERTVDKCEVVSCPEPAEWEWVSRRPNNGPPAPTANVLLCGQHKQAVEQADVSSRFRRIEGGEER